MAWIVSLKIMLISSGVVFMALAMKVSVPLVLEFVASHLPLMWSSFLSWLRPPYLYVIINGIIITIVASSRFHLNRPETPSSPPKVSEDLGYEAKVPSEFDILEQPAVYELREEKPSPSVYELMSEEKAMVEYEERDQEVTVDVKTAVVNGTAEAEDEEDEEFVISRSEWKPLTRSDSSEILSSVERPPVSARFGHRKLLKSSPEGGRALRVSKPKRHETLESTWKAITEGRSMPLSRHMKKCDTWENHGSQIDLGQVDQSPVKKSETFKDRTNHQQALALTSLPISGKLRKEPSLSQDELNRRVEAFINKFNEEMRLQRQESLNQYTEMINRGSH